MKEALDGPHNDLYAPEDVGVGYTGEENVIHKGQFAAGDSLYARLQRFAGKFGVEQRGIERVPNDERTDSSMSQIGTLVTSPPLFGISAHVANLAPSSHSGCLPTWSCRVSPLAL